jgi:cytochrome c2
VADPPHFMKSLDIDHARDGEVMIAYAMNGEQLSLVNGFPLRLVVPGWYATYWVKMLSDIEVLNQPDTNYWTKTAYTIPGTLSVPLAADAAGDAAAGEKIFVHCSPCHSTRLGENKLGPSLAGVFRSQERDGARLTYSMALKGQNVIRDEANLDAWLQGPGKFVRGTKRIYSGPAGRTLSPI